MQPASAITVRLAASSERILFMRCKLKTTCWPESSGIEPTAKPVLPPCGTMLILALAQAFTTSETSCTLAGLTTANARPCARLRQSRSQALKSVLGSSWVRTWAVPQIWRKWSNKSLILEDQMRWSSRFLIQGWHLIWPSESANGHEKRKPQTGPRTKWFQSAQGPQTFLCRPRP